MATKSIANAVKKFMDNIPVELDLGDPDKLEKGYTARAAVMASMPHSKPESNEFTRRNGNYTLRMIAPSEVGLPYGTIPRLLLAWMTTEAVRTKSRTLTLGKSLSDFLNELGIERTGGKRGGITALREQLKRLFNTSISCVYSNKGRDAGINMVVVDKYDLWWTPKEPESPGLAESTITLGEAFFNEITKSPVVFYMDVLKILRKSPLALDIYMWLTYRNSYANESSLISWESLQAQFGAEYAKDAEGKRNFKKKFISALKKVTIVYPEARKLSPTDKGLFFEPGLPHVPKTRELPQKP